MSEYEGPMNGLSKEEWDAFERDMASMPPYEPTEDDLDAMYKDYQKSIREDLAQKDDPVDMLRYVQERHLLFDEPAVKESFENWFPNKLGEIREAYQQQKEVADMDKQVFDEFGEGYGFDLPAYESGRLSAGYDRDVSYEERIARLDMDMASETEQAVYAAAEAQVRADFLSQHPQLYSGKTLELLKQHGYDGMILSAREYVKQEFNQQFDDEMKRLSSPPQADEQLRQQNEALRGMFGDLSGNIDHYAGRSVAGVVPSVPPMPGSLRFDAAKPVNLAPDKAPEDSKERNHDRLPRSNNYTPGGVTVYNRAIRNDDWSFDEYDRDDEQDGSSRFLPSQASQSLDAPDEPNDDDKVKDGNPYNE